MNFQTTILPLKDRLFRLALRIMANRQDAEDVVQETMLRLWRQRERWEQIESLESYAMTSCRNIALDSLSKTDNRLPSIEDEQPREQAQDPYHQMFQREQLQRVRDLMADLPEKQRTCMHLRDFEGLSYREISDVLQITEEQVKINIFRARQAIKAAFDK